MCIWKNGQVGKNHFWHVNVEMEISLKVVIRGQSGTDLCLFPFMALWCLAGTLGASDAGAWEATSTVAATSAHFHMEEDVHRDLDSMVFSF